MDNKNDELSKNEKDLIDLENEFKPDDAPKAAQNTIEIDTSRRAILTPQCALFWKGGCFTASKYFGIAQLKSDEEEQQIAGESLAIIADVLLPENVDPNSKSAQIMMAGTVLFNILSLKYAIYKAEIDARMEELKKQQQEKENEKGERRGDQSQSQFAQ